MKVDDEFIRFCLDNYHIPMFSREEFETDLNRIIITKRMFSRYARVHEINERLVLNNIIIILNVFGIEAGNIIMFYRTDPLYHIYLKTFLLFLDSYVENEVTENILIDMDLYKLVEERIHENK